ncbi:MAG: TIGR04551 family protein [Myxococcota bacterium]
MTRLGVAGLGVAGLLALLAATPGTAAAQPAPAPPPEAPAPDTPPPAGDAPPEGKPDDAPPPPAPGDGEDPPSPPPAPSPEPEPPSSDEAPLMGDNPPPPSPSARPSPPDPPSAPPDAAADDDPPVDPEEAPVDADDEGGTRPANGAYAQPTSEVYAEDWWRLSRPTFELHGFYRVRSTFRSNFDLNRVDTESPIWPIAPGNDYRGLDGSPRELVLCGGDPDNLEPCDSGVQAGADMRFRLNPELHISDNIRVRAQLDLLDNIVLGSTPEGYANAPAPGGGYQVVARGGYAPVGALTNTQWAPVSGVNSTTDSIVVKRVWGEYATPIGQLRFGRMPFHWGMGMLFNAGDDVDGDWQSTVDRLQVISGIRSWDLYFSATWDFANEGPNASLVGPRLLEQQGQNYDLAQQDDVNQWVFSVFRRVGDPVAKAQLRDGSPVIEGGTQVVYRNQQLAADGTGTGSDPSLDNIDVAGSFVRRGAEYVVPDAWFQFRYDTFRFEMEAAMVWGSLENTGNTPGESNFDNPLPGGDDGWNVRQFGIATDATMTFLDDKLRVGLKFGYATGDEDVEGLEPTANGVQPQLTNDRTFSTFRFNPNYRVDLILFRNLLTRVQGAYYFRPTVGYDLIRDPDGQKVGADAAVIWSRASEAIQTPGNADDLGVELNFRLYYQAKDGVLNDDPDQMGGFFTSLEYGVLFPLGGLGYLDEQEAEFNATFDPDLDIATAQTVRWFLGILF